MTQQNEPKLPKSLQTLRKILTLTAFVTGILFLAATLDKYGWFGIGAVFSIGILISLIGFLIDYRFDWKTRTLNPAQTEQLPDITITNDDEQTTVTVKNGTAFLAFEDETNIFTTANPIRKITDQTRTLTRNEDTITLTDGETTETKEINEKQETLSYDFVMIPYTQTTQDLNQTYGDIK